MYVNEKKIVEMCAFYDFFSLNFVAFLCAFFIDLSDLGMHQYGRTGYPVPTGTQSDWVPSPDWVTGPTGYPVPTG